MTTRIFAGLSAIEGHRGAYLLKRPVGDPAGDEVEFIAVTLWESLDAIRRFVGDAIDRAVVEPEARAALSSFDDFVRHFELAHKRPVPGTSPAGLAADDRAAAERCHGGR